MADRAMQAVLSEEVRRQICLKNVWTQTYGKITVSFVRFCPTSPKWALTASQQIGKEGSFLPFAADSTKVCYGPFMSIRRTGQSGCEPSRRVSAPSANSTFFVAFILTQSAKRRGLPDRFHWSYYCVSINSILMWSEFVGLNITNVERVFTDNCVAL